MRHYLLFLIPLAGCAAVPTERSPVPMQTLPPDLWTHARRAKIGLFLGPRQDSTSTEKGLIVPWPKEGPRIVWKSSWGY
jgi:hypothetical protein